MKKNIGGISPKKVISRTFIWAILLVYAFTVLYPIFWTVMMSLKPNSQIFQNLWGLPKEFAWDNYVRAWNNSNVGKYFFNSVFVVVVSNVLILITCIPFSYILGRFQFRGRNVIKALVVSAMLLPSMTALLSQYIMLARVKLVNTYAGLILVYVAGSIGFAVFMLSGFFATIPRDLEDAARIDGCGYARTMWSIMVPMAKPGIVMVTALNVLSTWNEYQIALTLIRDPERRMMSVGVTSMMADQTKYTDWGALFAAVVILMLMSFIIYVVFNKQIRGNVTKGAIK